MSQWSRKWMLIGLSAVGLAIALYAMTSSREQSDPTVDASKAGFRDIADEAGITFKMNFLPNEQGENFKVNLYDHGAGVAVADFDGDGFDDIYFLNQLGRNALYRNNGDGTFVDVTAKAGVGLGDRVCVGAAFGDYDNDGFPDLYVTSTRGGNVLFHNQGDGTFKDITKQAGAGWVGHSQTATFFDFDSDGFLDLLVTNTAKWTTDDFDAKARHFRGVAGMLDLFKSPKEHTVLLRNNGNGTFTDVTNKSGLKGPGWGGDVAVFDYDEDGRLDVFVSNMFGASHLYHNNGDGTFSEATQAFGRTSFGAVGVKAFDYDNDGKLDLLIADMHSDMWVTPGIVPPSYLNMTKIEKTRYRSFEGANAEYDPELAKRTDQLLMEMLDLKVEQVIFGNTLFRNLGNGTFKEVGEKAGIETWWPWGMATGDFNNDGYEDVVLPSGMGYPFFYWPNRLLLNNGDGTFVERSTQAGIEPPRKGRYLERKIGGRSAARSSRCAAVGDFRNVGRLDIVINNFNDQPYFLQNQFPSRNYIAFRLQGTKSNRDAIGALVRLHLGKDIMIRQVQGAGGYLSQSSRTVHFGLGNRAAIDRVEIRWPSGRQQRLESPEINKLHHLTEATAR